MRITELFTRTLREAPADAELPSHQLAVRAGLVRPVAAGVYALMPLGLRVLRRIEAILREEMEAIGGREVRLPMVLPAELLQASGRWASFGPVLQTFTSEAGRSYALGPTHEEVVAALAAREVDSYKQLPQLVYQIQTKYRHEPRPRGGLIRLREFTMKDAYSLDADQQGLDHQYMRVVNAYKRVMARVGLDAQPVEADSGAMGGSGSQEFVLTHPLGEDSFVRCEACGYAANLEAARFLLPMPGPVPLEPLRKVATPGCTTIAEVAQYLGVPTEQTLKAVFFVRERPGEQTDFVFAVVRGDLEINETQLVNALGGGTLRPANDEEIRAVGAVPGYASPIGVDPRVIVAADRSVEAGANFVAGANEEGYHLTGVNVPRDFTPSLRAEFAAAYEGAVCARCGEGALHVERAIELGHCFKLGTRYSEALGAAFQDEQGVSHPILMGSYGIGLERLMAAVIERHHDDWGLVWPREVAPFDVHVVTLGRDPEVAERGLLLYDGLRAAGFEALLDDRAESPGVKFADADLIGAPLRMTVSSKALAQGGVEVKWRAGTEREIVPWTNAVVWARAQWEDNGG